MLAGAAAVCATAYIIGTIHRDVPLTTEILGRTSPNLAALVPPLCAAIILFARGEPALGGGALLLVFTNIVAIQFSSSILFWLSGFRKISHAKGVSFLTFAKNNLVSIAILCVLAVVLTNRVHEILNRRIFETKTESILRDQINNSAGSYMLTVRFNDRDQEKCIVSAGMVAPSPPTKEQVAVLEKSLPPHPKGKLVELRVRFAQTMIINREGQLYKDADFELQE